MPDRTWEDLKNSAIMDSANHRAYYRIGIGDAFNDALDTIFFDLKIAEEAENPNVNLLLGEYKIAKVLLDHLQEANRQHEEVLSKMLREDIFERIDALDMKEEQ